MPTSGDAEVDSRTYQVPAHPMTWVAFILRVATEAAIAKRRRFLGAGFSRLPHQLHEGELAGAIDSDTELAFAGMELSDVDAEIADRISLERFLRKPVAFTPSEDI